MDDKKYATSGQLMEATHNEFRQIMRSVNEMEGEVKANNRKIG